MSSQPEHNAVAAYVRPEWQGRRPLAYRKRHEQVQGGPCKTVEIFVFADYVILHCPCTGAAVRAPGFITNDRWLHPIVYIEGVDDPDVQRVIAGSRIGAT